MHVRVASFLTLLVASTAAAAPTVETRTIQGRACRVAIPDGRPRGAPLVVLLHGCTQDPEQLARGAQMDRLANDRGWYVLYPDQPSSQNQNKCWNWFLAEHQQRGRGEPALLAAIVEQVVREHGLDETRVYVAGISAGAAMSVILGATYPDRFAAIGVVAGLEYGAATTMAEAWPAMSNGGPSPDARGLAAYRAMGPQARPVRALVFHGTADRTVSPRNGEQVVAQWAQTNDLALDGVDDDDVTPHPARRVALTAPGGLPYTEADVLGPDGRVLIKHVVVEGMGHAWPGGDRSGSYTDPGGPPASLMLLDFFADQASGPVPVPAPTPTPSTTPTPAPCGCAGVLAVTLTSRAGEDGTVGRFRAHGLDAGRPAAGDRGLFAGEAYRGVLSFDGASLPAGATVKSVTLRLSRAALAGRVDEVAVDVRSGALGLSAGLEQGDFAAKADRAAVARFAPPAADGEWVEVDLPADLAAGAFQVRLRATTPVGFAANRVTFHGGEDGALAPQVIVGFRP